MKKIILIIVAVIIVAGAGVFVYSRLNKGTSSGGGGISSIISKVSLNSNCKYNDPDLCKFINGWKEVKYYTVNSDTTDKDGKKSKMTFKIAGDDKSQVTISDEGKEAYNVITITNTTYTKDYTDNKWWKETSKVDDTIKTEESGLEFDEKAEKVEDKTTYKKIGAEACAKYTCFKYQVIDPANTDSTEYIYFDNKEYQLRKTRNESKDGAVTESSFDYSKISINEPSPTKDGSPYSVTVPSTTIPSTSTAPGITIPTDSSTTEAVPVPDATPADSTPSDSSSADPIPVEYTE